MNVIPPSRPSTYRVMCHGCKDWLPADRPGVEHAGEACVERCAAVFECPREAEQAAAGAGWLLKARALCPACRGLAGEEGAGCGCRDCAKLPCK